MPPKTPKKQRQTPSDSTITSTPSRPPILVSQSTSSTSLSLSRLSTASADLWKSYRANTPNSLLIIDAFLVFLIYVGAVQFMYACLTGGYPFNSFLAGFSAAVGQFVLAGTSYER